MKGEVPIQYIVAIVLGVVVLGILAYLFFSSSNKGSDAFRTAQCNSKKVEFCTLQDEKAWDELTKTCGITAWTDCKSFCERLMPRFEAKSTRCQ